MNDERTSDLFESPRERGKRGAREGAQRAVDHADAVAAGWRDRALGYLAQYTRYHVGQEFFLADARKWAYSRGLDQPPLNQAWGSVAKTACKLGHCKSAGLALYGDEVVNTRPTAKWLALR